MLPCICCVWGLIILLGNKHVCGWDRLEMHAALLASAALIQCGGQFQSVATAASVLQDPGARMLQLFVNRTQANASTISHLEQTVVLSARLLL